MLDLEIFLGRFWAKSLRTFANYVLHQVSKYNAKDEKFCESGPSKLLLGRHPQVSQNPSRFNRNLPNNSKHSEHMWIQIDEMDNIDKKVKSKIPKADSSTRAAKFFNAETQSHAIFALNWNVDADSAITCRGTDYEVFGKITQKIVLPFDSALCDPLGICSLFTIRMQFLLKSFGHQWDKKRTLKRQQSGHPNTQNHSIIGGPS